MYPAPNNPPDRSGKLAAVCAAFALLASACNQPQDASPPDAGIPLDQPAIEALAAPTSGPVGEWKLDESGGTTAVDSKNGFNATVFGGAQFGTGKLGRALNLNNGAAGTGGKYAEMPSNATLDDIQEGDYTISAWFFAYSVPSNTTVENRNWAIVSKNGQNMGLFYTNGQVFTARHYLGGDILVEANSTTFAPNAWHHLAGVVSKSAGSVKIYVDGALKGSGSFTAGTASKEYNSRPFRIGKNTTTWAADGKVDQVRIYSRALSQAEVTDLFNESSSTPTAGRFPVSMSKGAQIDLLGLNPTPDGLEMSAQSPAGVLNILKRADSLGVRVAIRLTPGNDKLADANGHFVMSRWTSAFDNSVAGVDPRPYLRNGTLVGHYAIDEPFGDFSPMSGETLESICEYAKSVPNWESVPCFIRDLNTRLADSAPAGGYKHVDAGWAQIADHQYNTGGTYDGNMGAYFRANLTRGRQVGLALMYGFNLLKGGREGEAWGCPQPGFTDTHNCAMNPAELREVADTLAVIGNDQGCGINGWRIATDDGSPEATEARAYYFRSDIQSALTYLKNKLSNLRPLPVCNIRGDLPAP